MVGVEITNVRKKDEKRCLGPGGKNIQQEMVNRNRHFSVRKEDRGRGP
jgi:hypothetical protein